MNDLLSKYVSPGVGRGRGRRLGPDRRRPRRRAVAGPRAGPRGAGRLRPGAACSESLLDRGVSRQRRGLDRRGARPAVPDVGFARRFATYKRATLLLSQPDRLRSSAARRAPARPARLRRQGPPGRRPRQGDDRARSSSSPGTRRSATASPSSRTTTSPSPGCCYQGGDVWLNTPAAAHGGVRHQRREGRAQRRAQLLDPRRLVGRDVRRHQRLGHLLGRVHTRTSTTATRSRPTACSSSSSARSSRSSTTAAAAGSPAAGSRRIKASLRSLGPRVMASRMVRDYVDADVRADRQPRATPWRQTATPGPASWRHGRAGSRQAWPEVKVIDVNSDSGQPTVDLGGERQVTVEVHLGSLTADDVAVELLHGPVVAGDELADTEVVRLELTNRPGRQATVRSPTRAGSGATRPAGTATPCGSFRRTPI